MTKAGSSRARDLVADGTLSIDDEGRIWRNAILHNGTRFHVKARRAETISGKGYLALALQMPDTGRLSKVMAHRLVWETAHGPIPEGMQINHKDLDKTNNRLSNLEVVTPSENVRHSYANGRAAPWSITMSGKWRDKDRISDETKLAVCLMREEGYLFREIAAEFCMSLTHVQRICSKL